jgi:hypothetical protein
LSNRKIKENELLNINYKSNNNKLYTEGNSDYIISNNSKINKYKTINILNINCKNKYINNSLRKKTSNKNCVNNENKPHKKFINKKLNKSYLMNLGKNNGLKKLKINNKNTIDVSKYFKIHTKNEKYRKKNELNGFISDYSLNKNYYTNAHGNYSIIFHGQGATGGVSKLIEVLSIKKYELFYDYLKTAFELKQVYGDEIVEKLQDGLIKKIKDLFTELFIDINFCYKVKENNTYKIKCVLCRIELKNEGDYNKHIREEAHKKFL